MTSRFNTFFQRIDFGWVAAAVLPLVGILPTIGDGVIRAADGPLHVHRIFAMTTLLQHGQLWPRWIPWFHLGYGYPVFNFYPPGTFYLGGILGILGISAPAAFTLLAALAWILGSLGTYGLAKRFLPGSAALLAAMLWSYAPSRLYEVWHQGSLPQMMAAALVPWVLWGLVRVAQQPTRRNAVWLALALAGMTFSHQPITLISGLFVAPTALILPLWWGRKEGQIVRRLVYTFGGLALGGGLTAIFLLPLALELKYVQSARQAPDVIPYLISNFLQPDQLFTQPLPMDLTDLRFELPETLGLVGGIFSVLGLLALVRRKRYAVLLLLGGALGFSVFMLLRPSLPLWEAIPFMAQLRFPSRLLRVGALFIALAGGAVLLWIPERWRGAALGVGLTITLAAALPLVYPNQRFVNWPNLSALDEVQMEDVEWNWGTTSYDEFNPIWGEQPGWDPAIEPETYITDPMRVFVNRLDMIRQYPDLQVEELGGMNYRITVADTRMVRFRQFYYPGWTATLDGQPIEIYPEDEVGQIAMDVPAGEHRISLAYTGTPIQAVGALVTMASLVAAWGLASSRGVRAAHPYTADLPKEDLPRRIGYGVVAGAVGFALVNSLIITPNTLLFRYKSPADSPAYMQTAVHQSFGGVFELLGFTLNQTSAAPGDLLNVELFWRAEKPLQGEYRPVIQLVNLPVTEAWGAVEPFFPGGGKTSTTAYPVDRFASEVHSFPIFDTAPPYVGHISVQMIDASTNQPLTLSDGSDRLLLPPLIRITGNGAAIPQQLDYRFNEAVALWCASISHDEQQFTIDLGWHVLANVGQDVTLFVHGYDANGEQIVQNDAVPLGNAYPSSLWMPGQNLRDTHTLPYDPAVVQIGIGLYTPDGRLALSQNGQAVVDNRVLLGIEENSCSG